ncbi:hypothetical protein [Paraburkholderia susongensis]|uniref:Uncharacterized protein n=1 Tax=Paraburkholderia susongensis TaxID=1515439 RepID=A0A1X7LMA9_9BURK|nr:hypothetical protein [Paraburkholderia susongensis]SMG54998.1 hypothetical protein SAMN06265784_10783 [Paraburkholderia susongensis]
MIFSHMIFRTEEKRKFSFDLWWDWGNKQFTREEQDDVKEVLKVAHEDFVRWARHASWTSSNSDMHSLRHLLRRTDYTLRINMMSDREVVRAISEKLESGELIFVPSRVEVRWYIEEVRRKRSLVTKMGEAVMLDERTRALSVSRAGTADRNVSHGPAAPSPVADFVANEVGEDVGRLVGKSPGLQADLKKLEDAGWQIEYGGVGNGSETDRLHKIIKLDSNFQNNPLTLTEILSHEVGHAAYPYEPDYSSKTAYVNGTLGDEAAATMSNIRTEREVLEHGGPDIGVLGVNHAAYNRVYDQFIKDGNTTACREAIGLAFGNEITSNTGQTYADYYGTWYEKSYPSR